MGKAYLKYGLALLLVLAGTVLPALVARANGYSTLGHLFTSITLSLMLAALALMVPGRLGRWLATTVLLVFSLIELIHTLVYLGDLSSAGYIRSLFMTTPYEADGAVQTIMRQNIPTIIFLATYYIGLTAVLLCFRLENRVRLQGLGGTAVLALFALSVEILCGATIPQLAHRVPCNIYVQSFEAARQVMERNKLLHQRSVDFTYGTKRDSVPQGKEIYVLVIDESLSYSHLSIEGYGRETTPCLEKLGNLLPYSDYTAPGVFTMYAVPQLITPATPATFTDNYRMRGVQQAFRECGFVTYWVTHAGQLVNDGVSDYVADGVDQIISVPNDSCIPTTIDSLARKHSKLFVIAHLWGSHQHYANATRTISCYTPNRLDCKAVKGKALFLNSYDNTILYTDSILNALTLVLKRQDAIAQWLFVSDHGEGPIEDNGGAHGYTMPHESEYHVPLILWYSDKYSQTYPQKVQNMQRNRNSPVCSDHIFWSVLDMAGIRIDPRLQQPGMSIFGDTLLPHKRQLLLPDGRTIMELK